VIPGLADTRRIRYGRFQAWNAVSGLLWAVAFVVLGYLAGSQYMQIERCADYLGGGLLILIAGVLLSRRRRHAAHG
jgi:membrane-associated protein